MKHQPLWMVLVLVVGCNNVPTTQTGVPERPPPGPPTIPTTTYQVIPVRLDTVDTGITEGEMVLVQHVVIRTRDGLVVVAAEVDFAAIEGSVQPSTYVIRDPNANGRAFVHWTIPASVRVANLLACARPPLGSCQLGSLLKWNR